MKYPDAPQAHRFELCDELLRVPEVKVTESLVQNGSVESMYMKEAAQIDQESSVKEPANDVEGQEELNIDPLVLEFLDADSYEERLNILAALHHRITDEMINTMAIAVDLEVEDGDTEERYEELKNCLLTLERFECNRLR